MKWEREQEKYLAQCWFTAVLNHQQLLSFSTMEKWGLNSCQNSFLKDSKGTIFQMQARHDIESSAEISHKSYISWETLGMSLLSPLLIYQNITLIWT